VSLNVFIFNLGLNLYHRLFAAGGKLNLEKLSEAGKELEAAEKKEMAKETGAIYNLQVNNACARW